ncbi:hypothetical protein PanWU01x14_230850 [Parasponia andersonii]|uniref:Transmembrane protein n=1 Tax=Parasponia andersonii TaxID=3476 RepID=A0A2P5BKM0_PARAD|nr:hypothetical protein PanWU01x14_230850 [Parasponia andersonii]
MAIRRSSKQSRSSPSHIRKAPPKSPPSPSPFPSSSPPSKPSRFLHFPWVCKATVEQSMSKSRTAIPSNNLSSSSSSLPTCFPKSAITKNLGFSLLSLSLSFSSLSLCVLFFRVMNQKI